MNNAALTASQLWTVRSLIQRRARETWTELTRRSDYTTEYRDLLVKQLADCDRALASL